MTRLGLLLDLDGTLAQSLAILYQTYLAFLKHYGASGTEQEFDELNGPPLRNIVSVIQDRYELAAPVDELLEVYETLVLDSYARLVKPAEGAHELLSYCEKHRLRLGLVTSSSRKIAMVFLKSNRLARYFYAVITSDAVHRGKPHPEPYVLALQTLGLEARNAIAVEDSFTGLRSSTAAGIRTIHLTSKNPPAAVTYPLLVGRASHLQDVVPLLEQELNHGQV